MPTHSPPHLGPPAPGPLELGFSGGRGRSGWIPGSTPRQLGVPTVSRRDNEKGPGVGDRRAGTCPLTLSLGRVLTHLCPPASHPHAGLGTPLPTPPFCACSQYPRFLPASEFGVRFRIPETIQQRDSDSPKQPHPLWAYKDSRLSEQRTSSLDCLLGAALPHAPSAKPCCSNGWGGGALVGRGTRVGSPPPLPWACGKE